MADGARAVFLDRDGTMVEDPGYLHEPERVRLFPGVAEAVRRLNDHGLLVVVVSNQAGIARGLYDERAYQAVQRRMTDLLAAAGARLDATYFCPHHPDFTGPCDCRKPGLKLFRDAQAALGIDLARSFWVGDRMSDVEPARAFGGRGMLVETGHGAQSEREARSRGVPVVSDLAAAAREITLAFPVTTAPPPASVAVLVSGGGTNLQALLDQLPAQGAAQVTRVVSSRADAGALERARRARVATAVLTDPSDARGMLDALAGADLVVLAGYLRRVPAEVVARYRMRMINIHPALLPAFGGAGMYGRRLHERVLASGATISGPTVHYVDEEYDHGPIIAQWPVPVHKGDTPESLAARVLEAEHRLLPVVVTALARGVPVRLFASRSAFLTGDELKVDLG